MKVVEFIKIYNVREDVAEYLSLITTTGNGVDYQRHRRELSDMGLNHVETERAHKALEGIWSAGNDKRKITTN